MIEESAQVISCDRRHAIVETVKTATCGSCQSAAGCGNSVLSKLFKRRSNRIKAINSIQAKPGDSVIIGIQERSLLKLSFLAYLLPLATMLLLAMAAQQLASYFAWQSGELPIIVGGLLGVIAGLLMSRRVADGRQDNRLYQAEILRLEQAKPVHFV